MSKFVLFDVGANWGTDTWSNEINLYFKKI
jgi:hypothetical protein